MSCRADCKSEGRTCACDAELANERLADRFEWESENAASTDAAAAWLRAARIVRGEER